MGLYVQVRTADIADKLEKHLMRQMKDRLINWGRWWFVENSAEINNATGKIRISTLYGLMQHGKVRTVSGYANPHRVQVDAEDALNLHTAIGGLSPMQAAELRRFYAEAGESGTSAQGQCRRRAMLKLIGLDPA
ncbi:MAG: hypothetical protein BWK73_40645 [Thiothrix lacustris]|uniref:Uncharacterized protein n=1 Tax=Thiothrix lacustris TaxID=525917 RepID=A0A1Y1QDB8_9GAMM|nr:MAG: hypothetical protein BWK73_40645 [Thiothrix lacustris]